MTDTSDKADQFFERYAAALLARDAKAIAGMYAVPSLILFPGKSIPVSDANQLVEGTDGYQIAVLTPMVGAPR